MKSNLPKRVTFNFEGRTVYVNRVHDTGHFQIFIGHGFAKAPTEYLKPMRLIEAISAVQDWALERMVEGETG